jgi:vacuolar protein sorting-associated protein 1
LKHGYYCVRLPDDEERKNKAAFSKAVSQFFDNNSPWNSIEDRNRFGIPNLVSDISRLLVSLIENK